MEPPLHQRIAGVDAFQIARDLPTACLFLDVDGTLVEIAPTPREVHVDRELILLLEAAHASLGGALALVSGRQLAEIDGMFAPLQLPAAGLHGVERRSAAGTIHRSTVDPDILARARATLALLTAETAGLLLEDKGSALALHYRRVPQAAEVVHLAMNSLLVDIAPGYELLEGDCVVELKPAQQNKATAVEAFLQEQPFVGKVPIYLGDDITDFDGFAAVRRNSGVDIAVGDRVSASWHLHGPAAVRSWLTALIEACSGRQAHPGR